MKFTDISEKENKKGIMRIHSDSYICLYKLKTKPLLVFHPLQRYTGKNG